MLSLNKYKLEDLSGNTIDESSDRKELEKIIGMKTRLTSLDFYRGLIMVLLMLDSSGLYDHVVSMTKPNYFVHSLAIQFTHYPWHGLHFWDLIQPAFMFIAGTAMAFSITKQTAQGHSWKQQAKHAIRRSWWLFFWGVLDYAVSGDHLSFELWDVLTQMSFTMLLAFFIFRWKPVYQILFSLGLLIFTECLYRFIHIPGFNQPFIDQHNFGNYIDVILMNKINQDGWVAINCIPTAAHTIWGAIAGKWLLTRSNNKSKILHIIILGALLLLAGYGLDITDITPIIKRIATSSFTLVTGGWCLLILAILYFWIDVLNHHRFLSFFIIVGVNSIFIYIFLEIFVRHWLYLYINTIVNGLLSPIGLAQDSISILASLTIFAFEWSLCFWLYRKKIFFKI